MNILVCVKQVVDSSVPLEFNASAKDISLEGAAWTVNPADLAAVRMATLIRDQLGDSQVTALSIGPPQSEAVLRKSLAFGADRAVRLDADPANLVDANAVAHLLAALARYLEGSLVLCGAQAADTMGGQTGIAVAVSLGWPVVPSVAELVLVKGKSSLVLKRRLDGGRRAVVEADLPAALTCDPSCVPPHYPSLPLAMKSLRAPIVALRLADLGVSPKVMADLSLLRAVAISSPKPRPKKILAPDSSLSAADRIRAIMAGGVAERQSDILKGAVGEVAVALVARLRHWKAI